MIIKLPFYVMFIFLIVSSCGFCEEVNVYSYRKPQLIKPLFESFSESTGIKVNSVYAKKGMLERIRSEGKNSPVDLVLTVDIGRLTDLKDAGLTQPLKSKKLFENIPPNFRDPDNYWFGLTSRARVIVVSKERVDEVLLKNYEDLSKTRWKGRICTRQGKHPYMNALIASVIASSGEKGAEKWLKGLKSNLARKPQGNDRAQVKAIYEGFCDIAVINHYYIALMSSDVNQKKWADSVKIIFPNQDNRGTHMNVSGVALARFAPNRENAVKLLLFLASQNGQEIYANENNEYPVSKKVPLSEQLSSWGHFKQDEISLVKVAEKRMSALLMADRVGYNN